MLAHLCPETGSELVVGSSEKRQKTHLMGVRVTPAEHAVIEAAAAADRMTVSGYIRECALVRAESVLSATQSDRGGSSDHRTADGSSA